MTYSHLEILNSFDENSLPNLDVAVLGTLERFEKDALPPFPDLPYRRPLVVGSENAAVTGRILFHDTDAVFANESIIEERLATLPTTVDGAILVSASGGKHATSIAVLLKNRGIQTTLLTNNPKAAASAYLNDDNVIVFPKNREPYTYNTSTYLSMILSKTKEEPAAICSFIIERVASAIPLNLSRYDAFFITVPSKFDYIAEMFLVKFDELFGAKISGRVFTTEQAKHAKTVVSSESECFVNFGEPQDFFGDPDRRVSIPLPPDAGYGAVMAIGYFIIGHIQKQHPPYFKDSIGQYTKKASKIFGSTIPIIVE